MQKRNCCADVFTFVDATALTSKLAIWEKRDKAISDGAWPMDNKAAQSPNISQTKSAGVLPRCFQKLGGRISLRRCL